MSSGVTPGGKQQIALAASPIHNLIIAAFISCLEKFLLASEIERSHCLHLTVSFSHSEPENHGMPGTFLRNVVLDAPSTAGIPGLLWYPL